MASVMTRTTAAKIMGQRIQQSVVTSFTNGLQVLITCTTPNGHYVNFVFLKNPLPGPLTWSVMPLLEA